MKLYETLRAGHVHRWNIVATMRQQSIAEHMWNVTMIATTISRVLELQDSAPPGFVGLCLRHDRHEVILGDVPTPTKRKMNWDLIEAGSDPEYDNLKAHYRDTIYEHILKIADILEGEWFLLSWGVPSSHVSEILEELSDRYLAALAKGQRRWPTHNWKRVDKVRNEISE
jgi:hypothetical protein